MMPRVKAPSKTSPIFQESVGADVVETAFQLLFLLVFALVAAGYVMKCLVCLADGGWSH